MWHPKLTIDNKTALFIWLGTLIAYPFIFKLIYENLPGNWSVGIGIIYGVINAFLYAYSFWSWYDSFKNNQTNMWHVIWFFLLVINGLVILAFISSVVYRIYELA